MKTHYNIVCVKYGTKYNSERVERLYRMVEKNCSLPFSFYCLTEDKSQKWRYPLDSNLDLESFWWKIQLFNLPWNRPTLYFDLDVVIQKPIDSILRRIEKNKILLIKPNYWDIQDTIQWDYNAIVNSSVLGICPVSVTCVYERFIASKDYNIIKYRGLDRYLSDNHLSLCNYLQFNNDYYHRWKNDATPLKYVKGHLAHDPRKTLCIITQEEPEMYFGLEKYFL